MSTKPAQHTPTPWRFQGIGNITTQLNANGLVETIADVHHLTRPQCSTDAEYFNSMAVATANAALIVRAVNAHDELLQAAKLARHFMSEAGYHGADGWAIGVAKKLEAAIAKADGK